MAEYVRITIVGAMGKREWEALSKNLANLVLEANLNYFGYDTELDCFFFAASKGAQRKHWNEGFVLSVADAEAEAWQTIHEPPSF